MRPVSKILRVYGVDFARRDINYNPLPVLICNTHQRELLWYKSTHCSSPGLLQVNRILEKQEQELEWKTGRELTKFAANYQVILVTSLIRFIKLFDPSHENLYCTVMV